MLGSLVITARADCSSFVCPEYFTFKLGLCEVEMEGLLCMRDE